ncbi:hypothetical protein [Lactococcus phage PMBT68]|nr:hypothetical protein [Lactococcus phage P1411]
MEIVYLQFKISQTLTKTSLRKYFTIRKLFVQFVCFS